MTLKSILARVFKPAARYPADPRAVFILALSVFSGFVALALNAAPESLDSLLPAWAVVIWGVLLVVGSATTLTGMWFQSLNGIVTEQIGSVIVGVTTVFYSTLAIWTLGMNALQSISIILAWGLACFIRWGQLQALILEAYKQGLKIEVADQLRSDVADGFNGEQNTSHL